MKANRNFQIQKKWKFLDNKSPVFSSAKINPDIIKLLSNRGITSEPEALDFLEPSYEKLADPCLLPDMVQAVKKIEKAVLGKKKIAIYGDYDVDGITATALLMKFFTMIDANVISYIPSRSDEGYGLNIEAINELKKDKVELIITVDCGSSAIDEVNHAKACSMDIIITDHHSIKTSQGKDIVPDALVINPKRGESDKPYYHLCGVGVAYYLVRALTSSFPEKVSSGQEKWWLDLVALGTICDVVPLTKDNRILARFGLKVLGKSRNLGIIALAQASEMALESIDSYKVGFVIGPRLNAAGRLENASYSLKLLITEDPNQAVKLANDLNDLNMKRQEITEMIVTEARQIIANKKYDDKKRKIILLSDKKWPAGVVGIAASRLVQEYSRPVLIMEEDGEELKGSARSINGFNIVEALSKCSEYLIQFGGHAQAAGLRMKKEHYLLLDEKLLSISGQKIKDLDLIPEVVIDNKMLFKNIDQKLVDSLLDLEPFGTDNFRPVFASTQVKVKQLSLVGKNKEHLKLLLGNNNDQLGAIAFQYGQKCDIKTGEEIDIAYTIEINEWKNQKKINLHIIDIKLNK
ncbi:MAG: single-stranded-DNA-specific exonuclease RecJ [Patescibacteria group bacterium]